MKEILEVLNYIRHALGGEKCEVMAGTNKFGGLSIRVDWHDGSQYRVERIFNYGEITNMVDDAIVVDHFIELAKRQKDAAKET